MSIEVRKRLVYDVLSLKEMVPQEHTAKEKARELKVSFVILDRRRKSSKFSDSTKRANRKKPRV